MSLHVEEHGEGPALLLVQGLGLASWAWGELPELLARGRRVVTFDNPGTGRSERMPPDTIEDAYYLMTGRRL